MTIGDRIRKRRESFEDFSQEKLAKMVGYSGRSSINKIELNKGKVDLDMLIPLAKALKTSPAYLMGWVDNPELTHEETLRIEQNKIKKHDTISSAETIKPVISKTQRHRNKLAEKIRNSSYTDKQLNAIGTLLDTYDDTTHEFKQSDTSHHILAANTATDKPMVVHKDEE